MFGKQNDSQRAEDLSSKSLSGAFFFLHQSQTSCILAASQHEMEGGKEKLNSKQKMEAISRQMNDFCERKDGKGKEKSLFRRF